MAGSKEESKPQEAEAVVADKAAASEEEQAVVAYYYLSEENPTGATYPGVPPGDILQHVYEQQPKWIQKSIAVSPMYSQEKPGRASKKATDAATKPDKGEESEK